MGAGAVTGLRQDTVAGGSQCLGDNFGTYSVSFSTMNNTGFGRAQASSSSTFIFSDKTKPNDSTKGTCDKCSVNFTFFKRKKYCQECQRHFCSTCLPKPQSSSSTGRQCEKCRVLLSGRFSRHHLESWKISDMRCFLNVRNISTKDCREKHDLIELVLDRFGTRHPQHTQDQMEHETLVQQMKARMRDISSNHTFSGQEGSSTSSQGFTQSDSFLLTSDGGASSADQPGPSLPGAASTSTETNSASFSSSGTNFNRSSSTNPVNDESQSFELSDEHLRDILESMLEAYMTREGERERSEATEPAVRRTQLDDIIEASDISELSVRQLKELLVNNFVDYKGCFEKAELVEKTERLWKDYQANKIRAQRIHEQEATAIIGSSTIHPEIVKQKNQNQTTQEEELTLSASTAQRPDGLLYSPGGEISADIPDITDNLTSRNVSLPTQSAIVDEMKPSANGSSSRADDSLCSICMDSLVDCILLECGHMVTCTLCGKRLADCPICRQYIVRVVRVFRS